MLYELYMSVPAATTSEDPQEATLKLVRGTIEMVAVQSAPESAGQVYCRVVQGQHVLIPVAGEDWLRLDGTPIMLPEKKEIRSTPYICRVQGVNLDPQLPHGFTVRLSLIPHDTQYFADELREMQAEAFSFIFGA